MGVPSYSFHSLLLKLSNKEISLLFIPLKLLKREGKNILK